MSIRQSERTGNQCTDLQSNSCSFSVELVFSPEATPGQLVIGMPAGYSVPSLPSNLLRSDQIVEYKQQSNNSQIATSPVMVHRPVLTFAPAAMGYPSFLVLRIAQPYTNTPLTITSDAPNYFQVASDGHPHFGPTLTLVPSPAGTYVHVRYLPDRRGSHSGQLLFQSDIEHITVSLIGRNKGLLSGLSIPSNRPTARLSIVLLAVALAGGLGFAGYTNRHQLFSAYNQPTIVERAVGKANDTHVASANAGIASTKGNVVQKQKRPTNPAKSAIQLQLKPASDAGVVSPLVTEEAIDNEANSSPESDIRETSAKQNVARSRTKRPESEAEPTSPTQESELERVLNHTPPD